MWSLFSKPRAICASCPCRPRTAVLAPRSTLAPSGTTALPFQLNFAGAKACAAMLKV